MKFMSPLAILSHLYQYRNLIRQMTVREVKGKYKGSFLGTVWAFIQPLLLLAVYTFVFSVIFRARWGTMGDSKLGFAMALFAGILTFNIIGEPVNGAPSLILGYENYVKKVIFPLEILPAIKLLATVINSCFGMIILIITTIIVNHTLHWTIIFLPVIWVSVSLFSLGWTYFLAALGVFVRDVDASVGLFVTVMLFLSPIFYPLSAVPPALRNILKINPISTFVEDARRVILWGQPPDWPWYFVSLFISVIFFVLGFIWFMKTKKAFADVL